MTDHGRNVLSEQRPVPYDPDGYLAALDMATGGLHPSAREIPGKSISTFRTGNRLASAVMLGAASEMVFLGIVRKLLPGAIADVNARTKFEEETGPGKENGATAQNGHFLVEAEKEQLPAEWQRQEQVRFIEKVVDLIRNRRNNAGHPKTLLQFKRTKRCMPCSSFFPISARNYTS